MINFSSVELLSEHIRSLLNNSTSKVIIILVGGCSRAGKTVLVSKLKKNIISSGINSTAVKLDSWLISVEKRKENSTVLDRYEIPSIISSIKKLQNGDSIFPPIYDVVSRKRIAESADEPIIIERGILFVEGVVALAIQELVKNATLSIFMNIPDTLRRQRLIDFYSGTKKLDKNEYEDIFLKREKEEVPFIKGTVVNADVIFNGL